MDTKTLQDLITDTERMLYQAAGPSVQVYSQDVLAQKLNQAFTRCFEAKFWPSFNARETHVLNGVTGKTVAPFTLISRWVDVDKVFRRYSPTPLTVLPRSISSLDIRAGAAKFIDPAPDETLFTVFPLTAVDTIEVVGRTRPIRSGNFNIMDEVPFDYLALEYHAAWEYAIDDASNAGVAAKFQTLFDSRMNQLEELEFPSVVQLAPHSDTIQTEWR